MDIKLLPCPFCGGEARLQRRNKKHGYYVVCKTCGCRTPYYQYQFSSLEELRDEAITTWNTRKPMDRIVEQLEDWNNHYDDGIMVVETAVEIVRNGGKE